ncbi:MAG: hypothetical protein QCI38_02930, partial [Candidatus Thermoplasmatota archaeon]|nr:hypothetical protein [Candidatus Thermoplasmatota archaeon]
MKEPEREKRPETNFLVDMEHAGRLVFWIELLVMAMFSSYLLFTEVWKPVFGVYNSALLIILVAGLCAGIVSAISWRMPFGARSIL